MYDFNSLKRTRIVGIFGSCLLVLSVLWGCATPKPSIIPAFRQGVVVANQQTIEAFADINQMLREQQLEHAVQQPTLNESLFGEGIPADARATWMRAFGLMEQYAQKIEILLSEEQRVGVEGELRGFGERLSATQEEPLPEGLAAGFVKLGGLLMQIKSGQDALAIMQSTDPAIQDIFSIMSFAIGSTHMEGLRLTVWSSWTKQLGELQVQFMRNRESIGQKRKVAEDYLRMLNEREAHDQLLANLRISFLNLASAHAAMAKGDRLSAGGYIKVVQNEYAGIRSEIDRLREARENEPR